MQMEHPSEVGTSRRIPERMFAQGEEPVGVRVSPYHKPFAISKILGSLEEDEVEVLRRSPFRKIIESADKPTFSGRFGRYIISRQLKVSKKHEVWFLFAGKPIRFSLREFAIVTGLNCGRYPARSKKRPKRDINEKPYWGELFGTLKEAPVTSVLRMLKKRDVTAKDTRIKYAYLALLSSVVLPTTHTPRISHEHAEKIKHLEEFLAFPWGRLSFELLISSIKERNEVSLSQNTIALKGFVLALQLVMIEAVPALTEAVRDGGSSGSEGDCVDDDELPDEERKGKRSISPGNARETDVAGQAVVVSIISMANEDFSGDGQLGWSDDEGDEGVDNLLNLIEDGFPFQHSFFTGGATKMDVVRMRHETRIEAENRKISKHKANQSSGDVVDTEYIAVCVKACLREELSRVSEELNRVSTNLSGMASDIKVVGDSFSSIQNTLVSNIQHMLETFQSAILKAMSKPASTTCHEPEVVPGRPFNDSHLEASMMTQAPSGMIDAQTAHKDSRTAHDASQPVPVINGGVDASQIIGSSLCLADNASNPLSNSVAMDRMFDEPTFSLGLTQEGCNRSYSEAPVSFNKESEAIVFNNDGGVNLDDGRATWDGFRKSKRHKAVPKSLVGDYACDKKLLTRAWEAHLGVYHIGSDAEFAAKYSKLKEMLNTSFCFCVDGVKIESQDLTMLLEKTSYLPAKVVDLLMSHTRSIYTCPSDHITTDQAVFLDTKFVSQLGKTYGKFAKVVKKESFKFPASLWEIFQSCCPNIEAVSRFYFPFNFDKTHWVGVCIDSSSWLLQVLDSSISIRTDVKLYKEMGSIAVMFPFILRQAGKQISAKEMRPLVIDRPRSVPQIQKQFYSAVTAVLLIQAHAFGGIEVCKCITPSLVDSEVERLAVTIVERNHGII